MAEVTGARGFNPTASVRVICEFKTAARDDILSLCLGREMIAGQNHGGFEVLQPAIEIMDAHRIMAISTLRADGWPQTTIVGYANDGWTVYFLILRSSQKFMNIRQDGRISFAVGKEPTDLHEHKAMYAGAHALEVTDQKEWERGWRLLQERHPNLADFDIPDRSLTALMRATCKYISVLDYSLGLGHTEALIVHENGTVTVEAVSADIWALVERAKTGEPGSVPNREE